MKVVEIRLSFYYSDKMGKILSYKLHMLLEIFIALS